MVIVIFSILILTVIILFAFPVFSPVPYYPSNIRDMEKILRFLGLKNNQVVVDLGAGDGLVIFEAAELALKRKLNTEFVAVEINPILFLLLLYRRLHHPNAKQIRIVFGNMFTMNHKSILPPHRTEKVYYLYISPWLLEKTVKAITETVRDFYVVSYMYAVPEIRCMKKEKGVHTIYRYHHA
jgi:hypothetical protein